MVALYPAAEPQMIENAGMRFAQHATNRMQALAKRLGLNAGETLHSPL
jgi:hypothetical protein